MVDREQEAARAATLAAYGLMDTPREAALDTLVNVAAETIGTPMATISLVDQDRQWFKASVGMANDGSPIAESICAVAVREGDETFVVTDASEDERFRHFACVTGAPHIRFYAGTPLKMRDGVRIGTLCVIDPQPRANFARQDRDLLEELARRTVAAFELRRDLQERGDAMPGEPVQREVWLDEAAGALVRAGAALQQLGATVALAYLDDVIDQVQELREQAEAAEARQSEAAVG